MAKRYDQKTKDEVVAYIQQYNKENGRGGQSAAAKKWDLNPITVKNWLEKAGVSTPGKSGKKKRAAKKPGRKPAATAPSGRKAPASASVGSTSSALKRMVAIQERIDALQSEYDSLKSRI